MSQTLSPTPTRHACGTDTQLKKVFKKSINSTNLIIHTKTTVGFLGNLVRKFGFLTTSIIWIFLMLKTDQNLCSRAVFSSRIMWFTSASSPFLEDLTPLPESAGPHTSTRWCTQTSRFLCDQSWLWHLTIINKARNLDQILSVLLNKQLLSPFLDTCFLCALALKSEHREEMVYSKLLPGSLLQSLWLLCATFFMRTPIFPIVTQKYHNYLLLYQSSQTLTTLYMESLFSEFSVSSLMASSSQGPALWDLTVDPLLLQDTFLSLFQVTIKFTQNTFQSSQSTLSLYQHGFHTINPYMLFFLSYFDKLCSVTWLNTIDPIWVQILSWLKS